MTNKDLENRKERIIKMLKIKVSQKPLLKNLNVVYDKRHSGNWCVVIDFQYNNKKYQYREDASCQWIENENGKEVA